MTTRLVKKTTANPDQSVQTDVSELQETSGGEKPTILMIDSDDPVRKILAQKLSTEGYPTVEAVDGETGIGEFMDNPRISVVIINDKLQGMSGIQTAFQMKGSPSAFFGREVGIILTTDNLNIADKINSGKKDKIDIALVNPNFEAILSHVQRLTRNTN